MIMINLMKLCFCYDMIFLNIFVFVSHGYFLEGIGSIPVGGSVRHDNCIFSPIVQFHSKTQTKPEDLAISCQFEKCAENGNK